MLAGGSPTHAKNHALFILLGSRIIFGPPKSLTIVSFACYKRLTDAGVPCARACSEQLIALCSMARIGDEMALPKICLLGKSIFILSGYENRTTSSLKPSSTVVVEKDKLRLVVQLNPDAVAFAYVAGEWFPAA